MLTSSSLLSIQVYVLGKRSTARISPEEFAVMIAKHFVSSYDVVCYCDLHFFCVKWQCFTGLFIPIVCQVSGAMVEVTEKPWIRTIVDGREHNHGISTNSDAISPNCNPTHLHIGFKLGQEKHTVYAEYHSCGKLLVKSGIEDLSLLKTTQVLFEFFCIIIFTHKNCRCHSRDLRSLSGTNIHFCLILEKELLHLQ